MLFMGKSTISIAIFNGSVSLPEGNRPLRCRHLAFGASNGVTGVQQQLRQQRLESQHLAVA
jgi:hypothetical protein